MRAEGLKSYRYAAWSIIVMWFLLNAMTLDYNGPFFDEGIYLTAGQRVWDGHGYSDGYLRWFAGSLLWPTVAGVGVAAGGLVGARAIALATGAITLLAVWRATENLFGSRTALWAALAFALNGPFMALARMAAYDALALAGIATSFWAITELTRQRHRLWLVIAALSFTLGVFAKYPAGLMLVPLLGVLFVLRREQALADIAIFGFVSIGTALAFFLPVRGEVAQFIGYRLTHSPGIGVTVAMIAVEIFRLSAFPLSMAIGGLLAARGRRRLAGVLAFSLLLWPIYHLVLQDGVSRTKHLVYGFLFAYPLVGLALSTLMAARGHWSSLRRTGAVMLIALSATLGLVQRERLAHAWPDARPAARYLASQVRPGEKLLINESWPYTMYLYRAGRIDSPWDVFDVYRITHGESEIELCAYDWFVDSRGAYTWPQAIADAVRRCGTFEQVYVASSTVVNMGTELGYVRYPVAVTVWRSRAGSEP